ncbi:hypothetical protein [Pseudochryseolinea flava]|nr:hypothetical protein [Pseudochryseolinea flava]
MKTIIILFASLICSHEIFAQIQDADTVRNPIKQGDPAPQVLPKADYRRSLIVIKKQELPVGVKKSLQSDEFKGWEKATFYRNDASTIYLIEIQDPTKTRRYRFTKDGKLIDE